MQPTQANKALFLASAESFPRCPPNPKALVLMQLCWLLVGFWPLGPNEPSTCHHCTWHTDALGSVALLQHQLVSPQGCPRVSFRKATVMKTALSIGMPIKPGSGKLSCQRNPGLLRQEALQHDVSELVLLVWTHQSWNKLDWKNPRLQATSQQMQPSLDPYL